MNITVPETSRIKDQMLGSVTLILYWNAANDTLTVPFAVLGNLDVGSRLHRGERAGCARAGT